MTVADIDDFHFGAPLLQDDGEGGDDEGGLDIAVPQGLAHLRKRRELQGLEAGPIPLSGGPVQDGTG